MFRTKKYWKRRIQNMLDVYDSGFGKEAIKKLNLNRNPDSRTEHDYILGFLNGYIRARQR